jgi:hypothetical protein
MQVQDIADQIEAVIETSIAKSALAIKNDGGHTRNWLRQSGLLE